MNVVPTPGSLSAVMVPPCSPTSSRTMASPIPLPSPDRERARSTRWNRSNSRGSSSGGTPVPVSATVRTARSPSRRSATVIPPSKVNFTALESRFRTTFSHMSRSTKTGSSNGAQSTVNRSPARSTAERKTLASSAVVTARSTGSNSRVDPARLQPREVQQRVHELAQPQCVALDDLQLLAGPAIGLEGGGALQLGERPEDQRQGGAELVADVGEEVGLGAIELGQGLSPPAFGLVAPGVHQTGGDLVGDQFDEASIGVVVPAVRIEADDQETGGRRASPARTSRTARPRPATGGRCHAPVGSSGNRRPDRRRAPRRPPGGRPRAMPGPVRRGRSSRARPHCPPRCPRRRPAGRCRSRRTGR